MTAPVDPATLNWGFSTLGCPNATLEEACRLASDFGLAALEVRSLEGRSDIPALIAERYGNAARVREILEEYGQRIAVFGTSFKLVGSSSGDRKDFATFAPWADEIGVPYLRAFGGGKWGEPLTDDHIAEAAESVRWWHELKRRHGWKVDLLMETHDAFSGAGPCLRLFEALDQPLDLVWDTHHTWRLAGEDPAKTWKALQPRVRHIHVKDSVGQPSARHPYTYAAPGAGEMPLGPVLEMLAAGGYGGVVSLEWEKQWHPYLKPLREALQAGRDLGWY